VTFASLIATFAPTTGLSPSSTTLPVTSAVIGVSTAGQPSGVYAHPLNWASFFELPNCAERPMPAVNTGSYGISGIAFAVTCAAVAYGTFAISANTSSANWSVR